jgi:hypothetical protein
MYDTSEVDLLENICNNIFAAAFPNPRATRHANRPGSLASFAFLIITTVPGEKSYKKYEKL